MKVRTTCIQVKYIKMSKVKEGTKKKKSKWKIVHQVCSLSGYILNEEIKPSTLFLIWWAHGPGSLLKWSLFWRHYGVEGGLGDGQDPWLSKLVARPGNWKTIIS